MAAKVVAVIVLLGGLYLFFVIFEPPVAVLLGAGLKIVGGEKGQTGGVAPVASASRADPAPGHVPLSLSALVVSRSSAWPLFAW